MNALVRSLFFGRGYEGVDVGVGTMDSGQDNPSGLCTVGDVRNVFLANLLDHAGPYAGITIGC